MLNRLYPPASLKFCEGGVDPLPRPTNQVAVVGGERRVVQAPVHQIIILKNVLKSSTESCVKISWIQTEMLKNPLAKASIWFYSVNTADYSKKYNILRWKRFLKIPNKFLKYTNTL